MLDLPAMIQECAPQVGQTTMQAIITTESGGNPWSIGDNTAPLKNQPTTKEDAIAIAKHLIANGHSVDLGLGQVNNSNLNALGLTVEQVFEPCTNINASAAILTDAYHRAVKHLGQGQQALLAALSAYNTGSLINGFGNGYVSKVVNNAGVQISFTIPTLESGAIISGKRGSVKIGNNGLLSPYAAPLDVWTKQEPKDTGRENIAYTPRTSPLEAVGFSSDKTTN